MRFLSLMLSACLAPAGLAACVESPPSAAHDRTAATTLPSDEAIEVLPLMTVHKTPTCGCCSVWVEHMRDAGFVVETVDVDDLGPVKAELGIPYGKGSCHTARVGNYFVEGHVPAGDVQRLLVERPQALGLVLPGMPLGSPGMEMPDGRRQAFTVELVTADGSTTAWAHHPERKARLTTEQSNDNGG